MKIALFLVGTLVVNGLLTSVSQAAPAPGRKLPGPSAVEAARLKNSPPPGYLSHYLPDDRYKIAGGVWKYVTTDLDTYYHIPSSPNMMRQPASAVIGFANSHDAEEAGYVADPTDGTVNRANPNPVGNNSGLNSEEANYLKQVGLITGRAVKANEAAMTRFDNAMKQSGSRENITILLATLKPYAAEFSNLSHRTLTEMTRLKPPPRLQTYHRLMREGIKSTMDFSTLFYNLASTGDISQFSKVDGIVRKGMQSFGKAGAELDKIRR